MDLTFIIYKAVELDSNFLELAQHYRHSSIPEAGTQWMGCVCVCVMEEGESEFVHMSWHLLSVYSLETLLIIMWAWSCEMKSILQMGK